MPMFEKAFSYVSQLFDLVGEVRRLRGLVDNLEQKEQQRNERETQFLLALQQMASRLTNLEDTEKLERRNLLLQMENEMLKFERRLPPPRD